MRLPGLIDTHVHLREPGATQKEDFETGTKAAVAGGYTVVVDMPNNPEPTVNPEALKNKISLAEDRIYADVGFHFGGTGESVQYFDQVKDKVFGLKVYMNHTTGPLLVEEASDLEKIFEAWPKDKIIMVHAEDETLQKALGLIRRFGKRLHVCHVNLASQVEMIKKAKEEGLQVTCETALHYLYLTNKDVEKLGNFARMRPPLGTEMDRIALWEALNSTIDTIASDHAPHTREEKMGEKVVNGIPGLETSLPLLLDAVNNEQLTLDEVIQLTSENPRRIFGIPEQEDSFVEIDLDQEWTISNEGLFTKAGWTPFAGMKVKGKVIKTVVHGQTIFENDTIVGEPNGKVLKPNG